MRTSDFYYELPQELIAQDPLEDRSSSRLMHLSMADGSIERKYPEQPNHPKQMYRLTEKAKIWKKLDVF